MSGPQCAGTLDASRLMRAAGPARKSHGVGGQRSAQMKKNSSGQKLQKDIDMKAGEWSVGVSVNLPAWFCRLSG